MPPLLPLLRRIALDLGPLVAFYIANSVADFFVATAVLMITSTITLIISRQIAEKVTALFWFSFLSVMVMGGLTLFLEDESHLKLQPTITNVIIGAILLAGLMRGHALMKPMFGHVFSGITQRGWELLSRNWGWFFIVLAGLNEYVRLAYTTETWVTFKAFGIAPLTTLFGAAQLLVVRRHRETEGDDTSAAEARA